MIEVVHDPHSGSVVKVSMIDSYYDLSTVTMHGNVSPVLGEGGGGEQNRKRLGTRL